MITYEREPTSEEVSRFFYRGLNLYLNSDATSEQIKLWWKEAERVMRWRLAALNGTVPDQHGRVIAKK